MKRQNDQKKPPKVSRDSILGMGTIDFSRDFSLVIDLISKFAKSFLMYAGKKMMAILSKKFIKQSMCLEWAHLS